MIFTVFLIFATIGSVGSTTGAHFLIEDLKERRREEEEARQQFAHEMPQLLTTPSLSRASSDSSENPSISAPESPSLTSTPACKPPPQMGLGVPALGVEDIERRPMSNWQHDMLKEGMADQVASYVSSHSSSAYKRGACTCGPFWSCSGTGMCEGFSRRCDMRPICLGVRRPIKKLLQEDDVHAFPLLQTNRHGRLLEDRMNYLEMRDVFGRRLENEVGRGE